MKHKRRLPAGRRVFPSIEPILEPWHADLFAQRGDEPKLHLDLSAVPDDAVGAVLQIVVSTVVVPQHDLDAAARAVRLER